MMKNLIAFAFSAFLLSCAGAPKTEEKSFIDENIDFARAQIGNEIGVIEASGKCLNPVTLKTDSSVYYCGYADWRSGFFPGSVWYLYELTGDSTLLPLAAKYTDAIEEAKNLTWHHDIGFIVNCSFGNGLRLAGTPSYKDVMVQAAKSLSTRFRPAFEQGNKNFTVKLPDLPFEACLDREAFSKIVSNLVSNALKYSDSRISLELLPPSGEERMFTLLVTNDGHLIPDSEIENIFNPFYRLKETENQQGSGIGLSLAHSLTEFHCGRLFYRQTPDGLNQFVLMLPEQQEDSFQTTAGKEKAEIVTLAETGKSVILIVEDQNDMRHFIARELAETYQVLEAENGKVALDLVRKNTVNLIISDVMMPIMDGFELCNEMKNDVNVSHIPFILLTAQHNLQSRLKGLNSGADAYMEKPFSIELLTAQVGNLLKSRKLLNKTYLEKPFAPVASLAVSQVDDIFLRKLNDYLEEHLSNEALSVEMLADTMGMSTSSLYRKVKGLSGLSPNDFIRIARLKKAILLMQNGENRISEIAFQVGFSSPAYFSTCFQKQYGKTPSEYMKHLKIEN